MIIEGGEHHEIKCPMCGVLGTTRDITYWGDYITCKYCFKAEQKLLEKHNKEIVELSNNLRSKKE